ncbi:PilX N-terminal domain-containing pilus assembly protein [Shewanella sp. A25]|nr:PilX N-terminal domain-containing pilus assembly protein [Shewanella shenzhenensis]
MQAKQKGAVLAIGLIFLLIITIIGVAGSGHSLLGERMAGNNKQISEAFMAAETGLVNAVTWLDNPDNEASWGEDDTSRSAINAIAVSAQSGSAASWQIDSLDFVGDEATIVSCGAIDGSAVRRCISSTYIKGSGGGNLAAMNIIGNITDFKAANSDNFTVTGGDGGPALATNSAANVTLITNKIPVNRMQNYVGGIKEVKFDDPFGDPEKMAEFIAGIKAQWTADPARGTITKGQGNNNYIFNLGTKESPKITYYEGDVTTSGNAAIGAGILVIVGNLTISGNILDFDGLIVVTGKSFTLNGGGNGNTNVTGAIVFANPVKAADGNWSFGEANATFDFTFNGGGNGESAFTYDKQSLSNAWDLLSEDNKAKTLWQVDSSTSGAASKSKVTNWSAYTD